MDADTARLFPIPDCLDSDSWYTPPWVFDGLGLIFDLDVAAPTGGVPWIPARRSYSVGDDGLGLPWEGLVWCNPPYSAPLEWCQRWAAHPEGCLLIRADLSTSGPFTAWCAATSIYVPARRFQFVDGRGGSSGAVAFTSLILGRGPTVDDAFRRLVAHHGGATRLLRQETAN